VKGQGRYGIPVGAAALGAAEQQALVQRLIDEGLVIETGNEIKFRL